MGGGFCAGLSCLQALCQRSENRLGSPGQKNKGQGVWESPQHDAPVVWSLCPATVVPTKSSLGRSADCGRAVGGASRAVGKCPGTRATLTGSSAIPRGMGTASLQTPPRPLPKDARRRTPTREGLPTTSHLDEAKTHPNSERPARRQHPPFRVCVSGSQSGGPQVYSGSF